MVPDVSWAKEERNEQGGYESSDKHIRFLGAQVITI